MSGKGISKLPLPLPEHDPASWTHWPDGQCRFETEKEAAAEDLIRAESVEDSWFNDEEGSRFSSVDNDLHRRLRKGVETFNPPPTPVSKLYMRDIRRRISGELHRLHHELELPDAFATAYCAGWEIPSENLVDCEPGDILGGLRSHLNYHGAGGAEGYLAAYLHTEFHEPSQRFRQHAHIYATSEKIECVEAMRQSHKFKSTLDISGKRRRPLRVERNIRDRMETLTYLVQSSYFSRAFISAQTGEEIRGRRRRIPEPHHARYLHWLDQYRVEDLILLMGLRVTKDGLVYTG